MKKNKPIFLPFLQLYRLIWIQNVFLNFHKFHNFETCRLFETNAVDRKFGNNSFETKDIFASPKEEIANSIVEYYIFLEVSRRLFDDFLRMFSCVGCGNLEFSTLLFPNNRNPSKQRDSSRLEFLTIGSANWLSKWKVTQAMCVAWKSEGQGRILRG